jgi:hypothetical protein
MFPLCLHEERKLSNCFTVSLSVVDKFFARGKQTRSGLPNHSELAAFYPIPEFEDRGNRTYPDLVYLKHPLLRKEWFDYKLGVEDSAIADSQECEGGIPFWISKPKGKLIL